MPDFNHCILPTIFEALMNAERIIIVFAYITDTYLTSNNT